jgi:phage tail sheath protein FI
VTTAPAAQNGLTFVTTVVDPGSLGGVLEKYELMTSNPTARFADGTTQYYVDAINKGSKYIRVGDKSIALSYRTVVLAGGVDDQTINVTEGYQLFSNSEAYDIQFLIAPAVSEAEQKAIIDVADTRLDCMPFVAPNLSDVVNNRGNEVASILDWRQNRLNKDSNYAFAVDNWGYMYDKYNDVYRWIPATGGTAGVFARTFVNNDPWISPAGLNRGKYLNYTKMAWSASQSDRDALYPFGINSIVTFPSDGIVLYGDKTLTQRPSAFSRVNVRWAFIVAKQSVAAMARYFLFEINDASTRSQFVNAATPFLRNMKNRRAFEDFRVICNEVNNDADTRLQNKMVVQLLLKPTYSINWIVLNLSAIRPDVAFTENA